MKWRKFGLIFRPSGAGWAASHAQNPFAEIVGDRRVRVHFAARDAYNRARGGDFEFDVREPSNILRASDRPTLDLGEIGCFDDCGVMPSCIVEWNGEKRLYYTGWTRQVVTPFSFYIGLALSLDGGLSYQRFSKAPVFGRTRSDPLMTASPWVMVENGLWRMWYVSALRWEGDYQPTHPREPVTARQMKHYYHIRYAESRDGINWRSDGTVAIELVGDEYAIARPVVVKSRRGYEMWYCFRGGHRNYRIGFASSTDGIVWVRDDERVEFDLSADGWDSEMLCYPCVFSLSGSTYMLYNGNDFGRDGVGLAIME